MPSEEGKNAVLSKKGSALVIILIVAAVLLTGRARLLLDDTVAPFRDSFREMIYLPRGNVLKIIACGFEAPLADALFIKGLIYYAESMAPTSDRDTSRRYTYELFDVITDLSPRFARAYQVGSLFLTASASHQANLDGIRLLEKGVSTFGRFAASGQPPLQDARWLFHTLLATTYDVNIQARLRSAGDLTEAAEARLSAAKQFRLAAESPGAPDYVLQAAAGYAGVFSGQGRIEDSQTAILSVWQELYNQAKTRGDKEMAQDLEQRIHESKEQIKKITDTRQIETVLSQAGHKYLEVNEQAPVGVGDLIKAKLIPGRPTTPLGTDDHPDVWLALPDGSFKSRLLAAMETENQLDWLLNAIIAYRRANNNTLPPTSHALVDGKYLAHLPVPPLHALGQNYEYDPKTGVFDNKMPELPKLPPEKQ